MFINDKDKKHKKQLYKIKVTKQFQKQQYKLKKVSFKVVLLNLHMYSFYNELIKKLKLT